MKNLFIASFAVIIFIACATGVAPVAHAEPSCAYAGSAGNQCVGNNGAGYCDAASICQPSSAAAGTVSNATNLANPIPAAAAATPTAYKPGDGDQYGFVMQKIMSLFAWLVGAAALTLDYSVYYTVVSMGGYVSQLTAIGTTWRILRDLGNIMLIFGFLAIGITTILNVDWYGGGKKMLPMLLVAAVFLNFSLFFAEAVIDVGNLFATQFYTQINGGHMPTSDFLNKVTISNEGISNKLMGVLGLQEIYGAAQNENNKVLEKGNPWLIGFMGILLFIVTAFVMFALAFVLIARFIILIFLLVLAPVGFAGLAIPQMERRAKQWWSTLFEQTVTAPILLLMLYVALAVITDAQFLTGFNSSASATAGAWTGFVDNKNLGGFAGLLLSFMVAMGLLIAVVIQSKSLSAFGSSFVMKAANTLTSGATKMAMAPVKFTGRQTANLARWTGKQTGGRLMTRASREIMTSGLGNLQAGRVVATALGKGGAGFVGLEKATQKTHEEYVKARGTAFEGKALPTIVAAQQQRAAAEGVSVTAQAEKIAAQNQLKPLTDEVARLAKIVSDNQARGLSSPEARVAVEALARAREKVPQVVMAVKEADDKVKKSGGTFKAAEQKEREANGAFLSAKKEATLAYTANIQAPVTRNPLTWAKWVAAGTHSNAAANQIVKATLKKMTDQEKLAQLIGAQMKNEAPKPEGPAKA